MRTLGLVILVAILAWLLWPQAELEQSGVPSDESAAPAPEERSDLMQADRPAEPDPSPPEGTPASADPVPVTVPPQALEHSLSYVTLRQVRNVWVDPRVLLEQTLDPTAARVAPVEGAQFIRTNRGVRIWLLPEGSDARALAERLSQEGEGLWSPALHDHPSSASGMRALFNGVLLQFKPDWTPERVRDWGREQGIEGLAKHALEPNWWVASTPAGAKGMELVRRLQATGDLLEANPNFWRDMRHR